MLIIMHTHLIFSVHMELDFNFLSGRSLLKLWFINFKMWLEFCKDSAHKTKSLLFHWERGSLQLSLIC